MVARRNTGANRCDASLGHCRVIEQNSQDGLSVRHNCLVACIGSDKVDVEKRDEGRRNSSGIAPAIYYGNMLVEVNLLAFLITGRIRWSCFAS